MKVVMTALIVTIYFEKRLVLMTTLCVVCTEIKMNYSIYLPSVKERKN